MSSKVSLMMYCRECHQPVGEMDEDEVLEVLLDDERGPLCFDCDPIEADSVPRFFEDIGTSELVVIGDVSLELRENELGQGNLFQSHAHDAHAHACSSSYTYLNTLPKGNVVLNNGLEVEICPDCEGKGYKGIEWDAAFCDNCNGVGSHARVLFLPLWLLEEGWNNV